MPTILKSFLSSGMEMKKGFTESRSRSPKGCVHHGLEQRLNKKKAFVLWKRNGWFSALTQNAVLP